MTGRSWYRQQSPIFAAVIRSEHCIRCERESGSRAKHDDVPDRRIACLQKSRLLIFERKISNRISGGEHKVLRRLSKNQ